MKFTHKITTILLALLVSFFILAGCQSKEAESAEPASTASIALAESSGDGDVTVEGRIVPASELNLSFSQPGQVLEILVEDGQAVQAGQVIASLDTTEALLSVQQAEADLTAAQIRYDQAPTAEPARRQADITAARLALLQAQDALADLERNASLEAARAQLALVTAQNALSDAESDRLNLDYPRANQTTIDAARAFYELKEEELDKAKQAYGKVKDLPADNPQRAKALQDQSNAQTERDRALATLNWYLGKNNEEDLAEADAKLALAQAQLEIAKQELELVKDGPAETDIDLAKEKIANAQALVDLANAQSVEQQIALTKSQLDAAQARLDLAKAQVERLKITAPFDGIVASVGVKPGEWVLSGQPAIILADLDHLVVETTDLSEIDVVNVSIGQGVSISVDALPELTLTGEVVSIDDVFQEVRGDITYQALIELVESDPSLRWGMTVLVSFEEP